jgi:hypothetical protein
MVDVDTFLTTLYVMVDDFCKASLPPESHPGPQAALSRSEVVTLAMFGQWQGFGSERGFYRYTVCFRPACVNLDVPWPTVIIIPERKPMTGRPL